MIDSVDECWLPRHIVQVRDGYRAPSSSDQARDAIAIMPTEPPLNRTAV